ncbi:hypothetical protein SAMN04487947_2065 [Halogeometricum rufum]|uniref:DUF8215 domain-containing protein n=1 Tax=Halogeometricum rufum TaxID=553469 RepID=A0A1I6HGY6_9EURY|nr:hypothetical protein [Halogeometricum rufum]SFR53752.1 hypothetical protein SAMN04487947_2065 [Halogeometricum rufum]
MERGAASAAIRRVDRYLDLTFFAGMEISALVVPTLWMLLAARPAEAVSLSAMTALCVSPFAVAAFRGGYVGDATWPSPGHFGTMPARSAYYSLVVAGATYLGVGAQLVWGSFVPGVLVPAVVCAAALSAMPRVLRTTARVARLSL